MTGMREGYYIFRSVLDRMKVKFGMKDSSDEDFLEWWRRNHGTGYESFSKIQILDD